MRRLRNSLALVIALLGGARTCQASQCIQLSPPPRMALASSSDVFLGVVSVIEDPYIGPAPYRPETNSDVIVRFRVLASWKGTPLETISVATGAGGLSLGFSFEIGRAYIVYAVRDREGGLHTSICDRTALAEQARADSVGLGPAAIDRLAGRSWKALDPPSICPLHRAALKVAPSWIARNLTAQASAAYPVVAAREFPYAVVSVCRSPSGPSTALCGNPRSGHVCPLCREATMAWCSVRQAEWTTREPGGSLPVMPGRGSDRTPEAYGREFTQDRFAFNYADGRQSYDSIEGQFWRGFGAVRDTSFQLALSVDELGRIYAATVEMRVLDLAAPHPKYPVSTQEAPVRADRPCNLYIRCGTTVRQFAWYPERAPIDAKPESEWGRLQSVYRAVQRTLVRRPEISGLAKLPMSVDDPLRVARSD